MWGVSPRQRMDEETYRHWRASHLEGKIRGAANGRAVKIAAILPDGEEIVFGCIDECADWFVNIATIKHCTARQKISRLSKNGRSYNGIRFIRM